MYLITGAAWAPRRRPTGSPTARWNTSHRGRRCLAQTQYPPRPAALAACSGCVSPSQRQPETPPLVHARGNTLRDLMFGGKCRASVVTRGISRGISPLGASAPAPFLLPRSTCPAAAGTERSACSARQPGAGLRPSPGPWGRPSTQLSSVSSSQHPLSCGTTREASGAVRPVPNHRDQGRSVGDHCGGDDHAHVVLRNPLLAGPDYRAHRRGRTR
jgi:hypothetical protein